MSYDFNTAKIICDSLHDGSRLTTFELTYPRYIHAEIMTHRQLSRNAQSSRAIPVERRLERVRENPVMPIRWGANQRGMQAKDDNVEKPEACGQVWMAAAHHAAVSAQVLCELNLHKQWANRLLEPFDTITVIATATDWGNFFALRCHPDAQPEFQDLAWKMADLYYFFQAEEQPLHITEPKHPRELDAGAWHLPLVYNDEVRAMGYRLDMGEDNQQLWVELAKLSVARCARVSYLNHDGSKPNAAKDLALHDMLLASGHMSPFEHQARAGLHMPDKDGYCNSYAALLRSNFSGPWAQYRKLLPVPEVRTFDYAAALETRARS